MTDVAIVGMAGRFPGAADIDAFWQLLIGGQDAIREVPADRWTPADIVDPTHAIPSVGGFLDGIDLFDAGFFGVSPREAGVLDPQQRLMLETSWRALEDAGQPAAALRGSRTGVYIGGLWHDHELLRKDYGQPATQHSIVGNSLDIVAARVSYFLGLTGPSMTVESSCSSSLVAVHLACQALASGEIEAALVGGSNLMLSPDVTVGLTHFGGLSPTGRCRPFGAGADGFVRGEGVVTIYLKTLDRALRDGDLVRAVITATAVNNDGGGASLVTPNTDAQADLLARVYGGAGTPPEHVAYVEAHGTGTARGDSSEAEALGRVLGTAADRALPIGSVKSNIGHLEPAAGLAGLVKAVLSLEHGVVPPSLNADDLNPDIDFAGLGLDVVRTPLDLPTDADVRIGVNSFGWGGTNAHVVLGAAPTTTNGRSPTARELPGGPYFLPLSAHNEAALRSRVDGVLARLSAGTSGPDLAHSLAWHRDHFVEREAVLVDGDVSTSVPGRAREVGKVAFVFPGQGAQWQAMGAGLYGRQRAFTETIDRCAAALSATVDWDLRALVTGDLGAEWLTRVDVVQPALWAMSVSLAAVWQDAGIRPDVVIGHSQGEIAAATVSGALSLQDGALIVSRRASILREIADRGRMLAVDLDRDAALKALDGFEDTVSLAVHNGPRSCVLSGDTDSVLLLQEILEADDVFCRLVEVNYGSHSPQIEPLLPQVRAALATVRPQAADIAMMSTVDLRTLVGGELGAEYWANNLRSQVRFAETVEQAIEAGVTHFIEVSPHPGLTPALGQLAELRDQPPAVLTTLRRDEGSAADLVRAFARAYVSGLSPWGTRPHGRPTEVPPPYPWQRESYRVTDTGTRSSSKRSLELSLVPAQTGGTWQAMTELSLVEQPWLGDHKVIDACVFPAGGYLALLQQSLGGLSAGHPVQVHDVVLPTALSLGADTVRLTGTWLAATESTGIATIASMPQTAAAWTQHFRARADWDAASGMPEPFPDHLLQTPAAPGDAFYEACARRRLHYGPAFRSVQRLHTADAEALAVVAQPKLGGRVTLWDGILQAALALVAPDVTVLPTSIRAAVLADAVDGELWVHARRVDEHSYDLTVFDRTRQPVGRVDGLTLSALGSHTQAWVAEKVFRMRFEPSDASEPASPGPRPAYVVCGPPGADVDAVARVLANARPVVLGEAPIPACDSLVFVAPSGLAAQRAGLVDLANLVGHCLDKLPSVLITVVTRQAQPAPDGSPVDPGAALYTGFTTVLQAEYPQFRARLVDIDVATPALGAELAGGSADDVVILRGGRRWAGRRERGTAVADLPRPWQTGSPRQPFRVSARVPGRLDSLCRQPMELPAPGPGAVELAVDAVSLNFIDVMKAMGVYPDTAVDANLLGLDCAGTITRVGDHVADLAVGDRVVACGFGVLASHATVDARHVVRQPAGLSPAQACALPMAMATAWHALIDTARIQPGETVLIHSGTGGVGLAAIAVACRFGARLLATAGSEAKREYLRRIGVEHVFDSRSLDWAAGVRTATDGRGVDVILNSLAGAAIPLGLDVLAEDGRFIELGKRDIYSDASVDLRAFRKAVSFAAVDIAGMLRRRPDRFAVLLRTVLAEVEAGRLPPLPVIEHAFGDAEGALRTMAAGEHTGKLVLTEPQRCETVVPDPCVRPEVTYLITGGLGALGMSLAEFLVDAGATALALIGRSEPTAEATARVEALRGRGATVGIWRADVSDEEQMSDALTEIRARLPALHGVFHAAGVLDDATLPTLDPEPLERVLSAKVDGTIVLDRLTAEDPLDVFVLFSSAAAFVGTAGQAAYAAANAYLDAVAVKRRQAGRAGLSVQWGPVKDIGLAASRAERGDRLADRGLGAVPVEECWAALRQFLECGETVVAYAALNPHRWVQTYPAVASMSSWRPIVDSASDSTGSKGVADRLRQLPAAQRRGIVEDTVRADAASVLMLDENALERDRDVPLKALGLDSLMAIELRNRLESSLGLRLTPTLLWKFGSLSRLGAGLLELFDAQAPTRP